jgi:Uma2 family endonuclease
MEPEPMATDAQAQSTRPRLYRISVRQYLKMIKAGVFSETARIELLGGKLVEKVTRNPPHSFVVGRLGRMLGRILPDPWFVSEEKPVKLGRYWFPEPVIAVVRGPDHRFETKTPEAIDLGLVVEVSESSYLMDRGRKWNLYASARVPTYWIVNLAQRRFEIFGEPSGRGRSAAYRQAQVYVDGQSIPVWIDGQEIGQIAVSDALPTV